MIYRLFFCLFLLLSGPALACGPTTDCPMPGERHYRIYVPQSAADTRPGAIVFAHGYRGSAAGTMRNKKFQSLADMLGVALIAIKSYGEDWRIPGVPNHTDADGALEYDYIDAVLADAVARFDLDRDRMVLSGFSAGGMLTWSVACDRGNRFAAYVPIAGTFWTPVPAECDGPARPLIHIHGTSDKIVPLAGRPIADTSQGDVAKALAMYQDLGTFGPQSPDRLADLDCQTQRNATGQRLSFCTHAGGHRFSMAYLEAAWRVLSDDGAL